VVDDQGGVWIVTGIVLGVLLYALIVLMAVAGFTAVVPLVVLPPVVVGLIGANNLLGGGRGYGRNSGRATGRGQAPPVARRRGGAGGAPASEEPSSPT